MNKKNFLCELSHSHSKQHAFKAYTTVVAESIVYSHRLSQ